MPITDLSQYGPPETSSVAETLARLVAPTDHTPSVRAVFHECGYETKDKDNFAFTSGCPFDADCNVLINCRDGKIISCKCPSNKCQGRSVESFLKGWKIPPTAFPQSDSIEDLVHSLNLAPLPNGLVLCSGDDANQIAQHFKHTIDLPTDAQCSVKLSSASVVVSVTPIDGAPIPTGFALYRKKWVRSLPLSAEATATNDDDPLLDAVEQTQLVKDQNGQLFFIDTVGEYLPQTKLETHLQEQVAITHPRLILKGSAVRDAARHAVALKGRTAPTVDLVSRTGTDADGNVWFQLTEGKFAKITKGSPTYSIESDCPLKFLPLNGALPFPVPIKGGTRADVEKLFSDCMSNTNRVVLITWAFGAFHPNGPYPLVFILSPAGRGKSFLVRAIYQVVDPRRDYRAIPPELPKETNDILLVAQDQHLYVADNIGEVTKRQSNALCILSTGGGMKRRKLYTDNEILAVETKGPSLLGAIKPVIKQPDLLDRTLTVKLEPIKKPIEELKLEELLNDDLFAKITDYFFTALATGLAGNRSPENPHRLIDWHSLVLNALPALGITEDEFNEVLKLQSDMTTDVSVANSPLLTYLEKHGKISGTKSQLSHRIGANVTNEIATNDKALSKLGWVVTESRDAKRTRQITIKKKD